MKRFVILAIAFAASVPAFSQGFADRLMDRYNVGYGEAVLLGGLARDFGLDDSVVFDLRNRYGYRNDDMLGAIYSNRYGRASWDDIHRMRSSGMGWGQIAHRIGMHPGQFNKMRKNNRWSSDRDMFDDIWRDRFDRKGTRASDIDFARNRGMSHTDAYIADQIRRNSGGNFRDVVNNYSRTRTWNDRIGRSSLGNTSPNVARTKSSVTVAKKKSGNSKSFTTRGKSKQDDKKKNDKNKNKNKNKGKGGGNGKGRGR